MNTLKQNIGNTLKLSIPIEVLAFQVRSSSKETPTNWLSLTWRDPRWGISLDNYTGTVQIGDCSKMLLEMHNTAWDQFLVHFFNLRSIAQQEEQASSLFSQTEASDGEGTYTVAEAIEAIGKSAIILYPMYSCTTNSDLVRTDPRSSGTSGDSCPCKKYIGCR